MGEAPLEELGLVLEEPAAEVLAAKGGARARVSGARERGARERRRARAARATAAGEARRDLRAAVGESQDEMGVVILAEAGLGFGHVALDRVVDRLRQRFALLPLGARHVNRSEHCRTRTQKKGAWKKGEEDARDGMAVIPMRRRVRRTS